MGTASTHKRACMLRGRGRPDGSLDRVARAQLAAQVSANVCENNRLDSWQVLKYEKSALGIEINCPSLSGAKAVNSVAVKI